MSTARVTTVRTMRRLSLALVLVVLTAAVVPPAPGQGWRVAAQTGPVTIAHSADGVPLRAEPSYGAEVLAVLDPGTVVDLRIDEVDTVYDPDGATRWWPVVAAGEVGWVAGFFLDIPGFTDPAAVEGAPAAVPAADAPPAATTSDGAADEAPPPAEPTAEVPTQAAAAAPTQAAPGTDLGGSTARVADPDGVNLRQEPNTGAVSLLTIPFDTVVELRIAEADTVYGEGVRWWPVRLYGQDGWVVGDFLAPDLGPLSTAPAAVEAPVDGEPAPVEMPAEPPAEAPAETPNQVPAPSVPYFAPGSYVAAITDDGTGLNIRADPAPDAELVGFVPDQDVVQVMDGPFTDPTGVLWYLITDGDVTGFVTGVFLVQAAQPAPPIDEAEPEVPVAPPTPEPAAPAPPEPAAPPTGVGTGSFIYPVADYTFTQEYGCSPYWFEPFEPALGCNFHNGIDLANSAFTPLRAADGGTVEYSGWCDCGLGYYVKIDHGNGFKTVYGHMATQPPLEVGQAVRQGDPIGPMGSTGNSTGPHVHFIVELNGATVDPLGFL